MGRSSTQLVFRMPLVALLLAMSASAGSFAEPVSGRGDRSHYAPVYQRRAFEWRHPNGNWHGHGHGSGHIWSPPRVSEGWFQRPYPYHLDYYRMRYGGSYAPYFGNLYGPPQVVTAPPYYGPYYGDYGLQNGPVYDPAYAQPEQPLSTNGDDEERAGLQIKNGLPAPSQQ